MQMEIVFRLIHTIHRGLLMTLEDFLRITSPSGAGGTEGDFSTLTASVEPLRGKL